MLQKYSTVLNRKKDGFNGQRAIVLPSKIVKGCESSTLVNQLFITDIGFYPKAKFHYRERSIGISQHILIYCVDGRGWLEINREEMKVQAGEFLLVPAHTAHKYWSDESDPWSIYWLHFKGNGAEHLSDLITRSRTRFTGPVNFSDERIRLFNTMYSTLESGYSADNLGYISMCCWYFMSSFCYADIFQEPYNKAEKDAIDISIEFMQDNLHQTISLQALAAEVHISPSHYSALFRKKTGYPPLEYFNHIKVQKACQYLQFTSLQVKEIAYKVGINDPYYFSRFFSNIMGMSPVEYRNRKQ
jgi:AraC-like DNA-binding protein